MNYTVQVNEVKGKEGNIRAYANIVLDEVFKITNIAIIESQEKGHFLYLCQDTELNLWMKTIVQYIRISVILLRRSLEKNCILRFWMNIKREGLKK